MTDDLEIITISTQSIDGDTLDIIVGKGFSRARFALDEEKANVFNSTPKDERFSLRLSLQSDSENYIMASAEEALEDAKFALRSAALKIGASKVGSCQITYTMNYMTALDTVHSDDQYPAYTAFITGTAIR